MLTSNIFLSKLFTKNRTLPLFDENKIANNKCTISLEFLVIEKSLKTQHFQFIFNFLEIR